MQQQFFFLNVFHLEITLIPWDFFFLYYFIYLLSLVQCVGLPLTVDKSILDTPCPLFKLPMAETQIKIFA